VLRRLFAASGERQPDHVLALGHVRARSDGTSSVGLHGIERLFPNSAVALLQTEGWAEVLRRVGDDALLELLLHAAVFAPIPGPNRTEPNRTEPNRTEPNRTEPNRTESHCMEWNVIALAQTVGAPSAFSWKRCGGPLDVA
jgi:hypothetical protein